MCVKQISSHFTITSHKEVDFGDGDKESSPPLARFLFLAALVVSDDPLFLPFFSMDNEYIFIGKNCPRKHHQNKEFCAQKRLVISTDIRHNKTRASLSLSLPFVPPPRARFVPKKALLSVCFCFDHV